MQRQKGAYATSKAGRHPNNLEQLAQFTEFVLLIIKDHVITFPRTATVLTPFDGIFKFPQNSILDLYLTFIAALSHPEQT